MVRTPDPTRQRDAERSDAQLDMLHSFAAKLNVLTDTAEIGNTITAELRTIVDYHNCRVYLLQDEMRLMPIAFRGELTTEYAEEDLDQLITEVGEGITGTVAATRQALLTPDAREVPFSVTIPGTSAVVDSRSRSRSRRACSRPLTSHPAKPTTARTKATTSPRTV